MGCHRNNVNTRVSYEGKRYWKLTFSSALIFSLKMFPLITSGFFVTFICISICVGTVSF